jgi:hypothetical protein
VVLARGVAGEFLKLPKIAVRRGFYTE